MSLLPGANVRLGEAWRPSTVRALLVPSFVSNFRFGCDLKLDEIDMSLNETPDNLIILFKFFGKESEWAGSLFKSPPTFISPPKKGKHPVPDDTLNSFPEQGQSLDCFLFFSLSLVGVSAARSTKNNRCSLVTTACLLHAKQHRIVWHFSSRRRRPNSSCQTQVREQN